MSKKALLVGINYKGTEAELNGCINDVNAVKDFITKNGYRDITIMTDDTVKKPTRVNILSELLNLILSGATNLFFHYSGHGSYVKDENGDEADGRDECLVPIDYQRAGMIIDDELRGILQCLNSNQKLFVVLDCCHSGTGMDLAYNLYERGSRYALVKDNKCDLTRGQVIMISGCQDNQTSADAFIGGKYQGALTESFMSAINGKTGNKSYNRMTWEELIQKIKKRLQGKYTQRPNLASGKQLNLRSRVEL